MRRTIKGDITTTRVDAVVNAANKHLLGGGGVDGAIHMAAGPELIEECKEIGGCATGEACITKAYNLPAKYIIHTAGPIWNNEENHEIEIELLKKCYWNSLVVAKEYGCKTVAFPNISTGVYGVPKIEAAHAAIETVTKFLNEIDNTIDVVFVCHDIINYRIYQELCPKFELINP